MDTNTPCVKFDFESRMAGSKELRIPKEWSKYHHDIDNEPIDPELFSEAELCAWLDDLGLCFDKSLVTKYVQVARPYFLVRHQVVLVPNNTSCRKIFKLWAHATIALFISDDFLEALSENEMRQVCEAFQKLDDQLGELFPRFPAVGEMKQSLLQQNVDEKWVPHVVYFLDFANNVAKSIIEQGNTPIEDVNKYWRRLVVMISIYYQGVAVEVKRNIGSYAEDVWTRMLTAAAMMWTYAPEIMLKNVNQTTENVSLLNQLYFLANFFSMGVNDVYSYSMEMTLEFGICNMIQTIAHGKDGPTEDEAAMKVVQILNAVLKKMYDEIKKTKEKNPENQELWKLLDSIGLATAGWYYWHHYSPRYDNARWRLSAVDVEENELNEWRKCSEKEVQMEEVTPLLLNCWPTARMINDAIISGLVNMHLYSPA